MNYRKNMNTKRALHLAVAFAAFALCTACTAKWHVAEVERTRLLVDSRFDNSISQNASDFLAPYKRKVDSVMSPVVGKVACGMAASKPESKLSNLLSDILVWEGQRRGEKPDFSVYNMGGMRAAFSEGDVTFGDVLAVAPFENKICFLTLTGTKTLELCRQLAAIQGEGVSHGFEMVIGKDNSLKSVKINGKEINPDSSYRIATLDYLAQGNGGLTAFKDATAMVSPQDEANNVRFIIIDYFKAAMAEGRAVDSKIEGRIKIE